MCPTAQSLHRLTSASPGAFATLMDKRTGEATVRYHSVGVNPGSLTWLPGSFHKPAECLQPSAQHGVRCAPLALTNSPSALPSVPPTISPEPPHLWLPCFSPWEATAGAWRVEVREIGDLLLPCRARLHPPLVRWHSPRSLRPQGPGQGCLHGSAGTDCSHYCRFRVFHHP